MAKMSVCTASRSALAIAALACAVFARADNATPVLTAHFAGNTTFLFEDAPLRYIVIASDAEEGDSVGGGIDPAHIAVAIERDPQGDSLFEPPAIDPRERAQIMRGEALVAAGDCVLCHTQADAGAIPSYAAIARMYAGRDEEIARLAEKIIAGGKGVWGEMPMTPHPDLSREDARAMVRYILSSGDAASGRRWLPALGTLAASRPAGERPGGYLFWASYRDRGGATGTLVKRFRAPRIAVAEHDGARDMAPVGESGARAAIAPRAFLRFEGIDLTGIGALRFEIAAGVPFGGGDVEVRVGSPGGRRIARVEVPVPCEGEAGASVLVPIAPVAAVVDLHLVFPDVPASGGVPLVALGFERGR